MLVLRRLSLLRQPPRPPRRHGDSVWQEDAGSSSPPTRSTTPFLETVVRALRDERLPAPDRAADRAPRHRTARSRSTTRRSCWASLGPALIVTLLAFYVYSASRRPSMVRDPLGDVFLAWGGLVLASCSRSAGYETNANVANLHWYLIYALFWVFIAPPRTRGRRHRGVHARLVLPPLWLARPGDVFLDNAWGGPALGREARWRGHGARRAHRQLLRRHHPRGR